ncbi:hypothetical protein [Spirosoma utsteinense]|uniref:DUF4142 domain-containing protein n=1 Tax=Spirosoma utsteinense TaxID=2585773 RepID=A0ABR6W6Q5_9BACT|nr:hypothetical protein [Spirosoma utsteinense]MBC3787925.1 hypothetical protein [Spirosoma utsteinense]MBC3792152.1 hypothetical protein [Spirosoma utsteinense]
MLFLTSLIAGLTACSSADKQAPLLEEAGRYHTEATAIQALVEPKIEQIDSLKIVLSAQKTTAAGARIATLDSLKTAFEAWEENLVEVPGMPHNHSHRTGGPEHGDHAPHKHGDATLKDLPADQMRDLQRELLHNIRQIQTRLKAVTN